MLLFSSSRALPLRVITNFHVFSAHQYNRYKDAYLSFTLRTLILSTIPVKKYWKESMRHESSQLEYVILVSRESLSHMGYFDVFEKQGPMDHKVSYS